MDWPVTSKPYAIAAEDGKVRSNSKSLFRNYLQCLCQVKPSSNPSSAIKTSIVDATLVVRMISIKNVNPSIFLSWAKNFLSYIHGLPEDNLHIIFDKLQPSLGSNKSFYLREELTEDTKRKFLV